MSDSFGMGYYEGDFTGDIDDAPPQQPAKKPSGFRQWAKSIQTENKALKAQIARYEKELAELEQEDDPEDELPDFRPGRSPFPEAQLPQRQRPMLTPEEQLQVARFQEAGVVGIAPPQGTQHEQAQRIASCRSAEELSQYLASQGNQIAQHWNTGGPAGGGPA